MNAVWIFALIVLALITLPVVVFIHLMIAYYKAQAILEEDNCENRDSN